MPAFLVPLHEHNDCHTPAGSPQGGQFCPKGRNMSGFKPGFQPSDGSPPYLYYSHDPVAGQGLPRYEAMVRTDVGTMEVRFWTKYGPGQEEGGYLTVVLPHSDERRRHAEVSEISISKSLQGKGYGQKLYLAAAAEAKKMGYAGLKSSLVTSRTDKASRAWDALTRKGKAKRVKTDRGYEFDVLEARLRLSPPVV